MDSIVFARSAEAVGRYREAFASLEATSSWRGNAAARAMRAELAAFMGDIGQAEALLGGPESRGQSESDLSRFEFVRSRVCGERGELHAELRHLQKSLTYAEKAKDTFRCSIARLWLLGLVADLSGYAAASAVGSALRADINKLGDPTMTAAFHVFVGELEAKRGFLDQALRRTQLARRLLDSSHHLLFEAWAHNNLVAISVLKCDFDRALEHARSALTLCNECGAVVPRRSCLGNLGLILTMLGHFDEALEHLREARGITPFYGEQTAGASESMARVCLAQGRFDDCESLVNEIELAIGQPDGAGRYVHRHTLLTKAEVLARQHRWQESLASLDRVESLARVSEDGPLHATSRLLRAEVLARLGRPEDAWRSIAEAVPSIASHPPDMFGLYERVVACVLVAAGDSHAGQRHQDRARRIYEALHNAPALVELDRSWSEAITHHPQPHVQPKNPQPGPELVQNIAALMRHAGHAELLASDIVSVVADAQCATGAVAVLKDSKGADRILAEWGKLGDEAQAQTLRPGAAQGRAVEVRVQVLPDVESRATFNSIRFLLDTIADLEQSRIDREERLTLWPVEDPPAGADDAIVAGQMGELMTFARKVAQTNVTVLITGESGTGKEVLARAIHGFSSRANKPFVPFNCTAVPRDLLESHLFGYRRGAFTGPERDHPGLIRTAREGTLFLDEIGELGLDLQPKLLRFLELGEVSPLGETGPVKVDARIVAATNANIDRMVEEGRFREDLYYRLNVIAIPIPPLRERRDEIPLLVHHFVRKAAKEFGKGRVRVSEEAMERLLLFSWPGNVRQLQNELRRMVALAEPDDVLGPASLSAAIRRDTHSRVRSVSASEIAVPLHDKLPFTISRIEREMIKAALQANDGRVDAASKALGISRKGLYLKRQRLGV